MEIDPERNLGKKRIGKREWLPAEGRGGVEAWYRITWGCTSHLRFDILAKTVLKQIHILSEFSSQ